MKTTIWMAFFAIAATCALAEVPPVRTAEPVAQKWGEEADDEVQREGLLFWRDDCGALYIGDGETPGGKAVCVGLPPDLYSWTNDVSANGHALLWGGGWSQQAEGGSLLVRLGTNSWLRFVAADAGTLANLAVSDLDQANGTMRLTADTADPGAVLLVATNLLAPEAWQPATNGEIVASTDASTTWLITLLDTPFEVYRVRTSVTLEAGIHAERTLHANAGIEMAGEKWDAWPDIGTIATNAADAAVAPVAGDLADHAADTDNPHGVTAAQVGALSTNGGSVRGDIILGTNSTTPALVFQRMAPNDGNLDYRLRADGAGFFLGVRSSTGTWADHFRFLPGPAFAFGKNTSRAGYYAFAHGEDAEAPGLESCASGYHVTASGFAARATGGWSQALESYAEAGGYAAVASNAMSHVWNAGPNTNNTYGSHGDGTWNINPVGGLDGTYIGETNMADHLAAAVAPVAGRVGELEARSEEYWCKWTSASISSNTTYKIPTNWPARTVYCHVYCEQQGVVLAFPDWTPDAPCTLHLVVNKTSGGGIVLQAADGSALQTMTSSGSIIRDLVFSFVPSVGWVTAYYTLAANSHVISGETRASIPASLLPEDGRFAPVTEPAASLLSLSPSQSPSLSAGHLELLDSLEALDVPAADEPDEFEPAEEVVE